MCIGKLVTISFKWGSFINTCMKQCGKPFERDNVIVINPTKEEVEGMKAVMKAKKAKAKAEKVRV